MEKDDVLVDRLKARLRDIPIGMPAVETIQPEIRSAAQYASAGMMQSGFRIDDDADDEI